METSRAYKKFREWYESPEEEDQGKEPATCDNCGRRETCEFTEDECGSKKDFDRWIEEE